MNYSELKICTVEGVYNCVDYCDSFKYAESIEGLWILLIVSVLFFSVRWLHNFNLTTKDYLKITTFMYDLALILLIGFWIWWLWV